MEAAIKAFLSQIPRLATFDELVANEHVQAFLRRSETLAYYQRLKEILQTDDYLKLKVRLKITDFLKLSWYISPEQHYRSEVIGLIWILSQRPSIRPVISRKERDRILEFLDHIQTLLETYSKESPLTNYPFDESDGEDLPKEIRPHPLCVRCGSLSGYLCSCKSVSYCSLWCQQLHWSTHKPDCSKVEKEKRD